MSLSPSFSRRLASIVSVTALFLPGLAAAGDLKALPEASSTSGSADSTIYFSGIDTAHRSFYLYQGATFALNRDIGRDGVMLRTYAGYASYTFDSTSTTRTQGTETQVDGMIGYQFIRNGITTSAFIGPDFHRISFTPKDPTIVPQGTKVGVKFAGEIEGDENAKIYGNLSGEYSTAFDSYWSRGRLGYNFGRVTVGPEAIFFGQQGFHAERIGAFATFKLNYWK